MFADAIKQSASGPEWLLPAEEKFFPADAPKAAGILFLKSDFLGNLPHH